MTYTDHQTTLTKERLEDLRKERNLSFKQLAELLKEHDIHISHTNLKNYEINDILHPLYHRTKTMSLEYFVALADVYDVSVDYLLGRSNSRKAEYHNISEELCLDDKVIETLKSVIAEDGQAIINENAHPFLESRIHLLNEIFLDERFVEVLGLLCDATSALHRYEVFEVAKTRVREKRENFDNFGNVDDVADNNEVCETINAIKETEHTSEVKSEIEGETAELWQAEQLLNRHGLAPVNNKIIHDLFVSQALSLIDNLFGGLSEKILGKELERRRKLVMRSLVVEVDHVDENNENVKTASEV